MFEFDQVRNKKSMQTPDNGYLSDVIFMPYQASA
jgi:hypothetical protein